MNILDSTFKQTLDREGIEIAIGNIKYKVFFRRNEKGNETPYTTLYAPLKVEIKQGDVFSLYDDKFLIIKAVTSENTVYQKYECIKCNQSIKWMFGKGDLVIFDIVMSDIADKLLTNKNGTITTSSTEFLLPLNPNTRRIGTNDRFFCGSFHMAWKVVDFNYSNNMLYLYAERDSTMDIDDKANGIANRWKYEAKPDSYKVVLERREIEVKQAEIVSVGFQIFKNGILMENPVLAKEFIGDLEVTEDLSTEGNDVTVREYLKIECDNENVEVSIKNNQINIVGFNVGESKVKVSYLINENDTCVSDTVYVSVQEQVTEIGEIKVSPIYNNMDYFELLQGRSQEFVCSIDGVTDPVWDISLDGNGNVGNYTSDIGDGTFTVKNVKMSTYPLIYYIAEETTGKNSEYRIRLKGLF